MTPRVLVLLPAVPLSVSSSVNVKEATYFNDITDVEIVYKVEDMEPVIQKNDILSQELFTSPYYYLQSNDVIYVTPNKSKIQSTGNARLWLPFAIASITLGIVILDRLN